jgi:transcriptional regulator with XRE-family HTH domain
MVSFGERLQKALDHSFHSQQELADYLQIHKTVVNSWIKDRSSPNKIEKFIPIAKFLNVSPAWLAGFDVSMEEFKLDDNEIKLLKKLKLLNDEGFEKTESYVDDLLESPKYQKSERTLRDKKLA